MTISRLGEDEFDMQKEDGTENVAEGLEKRVRTETEMGKEFKKDLYRKGFRYALSAWRIKMCYVSKSLIDNDDEETFKQ